MSTDGTDGNDSDGVECPKCGSTYDSRRGMYNHHKAVHGGSVASVEVDCEWCGEALTRRRWRVESYDNQFCDGDCHAEYRSAKIRGESHPRYEDKVERDCRACGETFKIYPYRKKSAKFCSHECHGEWKTKTGTEEVECESCGDRVKKHKRMVERADHHFCSKSCYGEWAAANRNGTDHPLWDGGGSVTTTIRTLINESSWNRIATDNRTDECYMCGVSGEEYGLTLNVHHIIPVMFGGSNHPDNLMTLCKSCHRTVEIWTREQLKPVAYQIGVDE